MEFVSNLILASVRMATPLIFLSLSELYSQRAGLVHIGLEGLAAIGSLTGFLVSHITGSPLMGVCAGTMANGALSAGAISDLVPADIQEQYLAYIDQMVAGTFMQ